MSSEQHKLMRDLNQVIKDAEELLRNSEGQNSEAFSSARHKFEHTLKHAKDELLRIEDLLITKTKDAAQATDQYVKENPWQSVGLGACVGLLVGLLISRK
jgi:ElaB/YqjD/DUF883 family membrane-anchored ribosome-binding protein